MYIKQNPSDSANFGDFGFIPWQAVVGIIQGAVLGGAAINKYSATKKYLKKQEHTQELTHAQQEEIKRKELALKAELLSKESQKQLYEDQRAKRLVIISVIVMILVAVIGLVTYYMVSVE